MRHRADPRFVAAVLVLVLTGCAETYKLRPSRADERAILAAAVQPLLGHIVSSSSLRSCTFAMSLNDVAARQVEVAPSTGSDSCLDFFVTSGALSLPRPELRALLAHGLAHVQLGHQTTAGRRVSGRLGYGGGMGGNLQRLYTPDEEAQADRYAASLLNTVSLDPSGCQALGAVLERAVAEKDRWKDWREQHPVAPARAAAARRACGSPR
jgi:hypothetical protein